MQNGRRIIRNASVVGLVAILIGIIFFPAVSTHVIQADFTKNRAISETNGNTLYVGGSGPNNYTKIQDAIDNASDGDTIFVYNGTYYENVVVDKSITLTGEDRNTTIIDGDGSGDVVRIISDQVTISRFTIRNSEYWLSGIRVDSAYNYILNNNILNNHRGIFLFRSSSSNIISNNIISNNTIGIDVYSSHNSILDNSFFDDGILIGYLPTARYSYPNTISNNTVNGEPLIYLEEKFDIAMAEDVGQIILVNCSNITIQNQELSSTYVGIELLNTDDCLISDSNIFKNDNGIILSSSKNNHIAGNKFSNNNIGITVLGAVSGVNNVINDNVFKNNVEGIDVITSNNMIRNNTFTNHRIGIDVSNFKNKIIGNTIQNNIDKGIYVWGSYFHTIVENTISNSYYGIYLVGHSLKGGSDWNRISSNTLQNNKYGVMLTQSSEHNFIYNNNFMDNNENASFKDCRSNFWFRNYWNKPRLLPKVIEGTAGGRPWINIDWFPRMMPYEDG